MQRNKVIKKGTILKFLKIPPIKKAIDEITKAQNIFPLVMFLFLTKCLTTKKIMEITTKAIEIINKTIVLLLRSLKKNGAKKIADKVVLMSLQKMKVKETIIANIGTLIIESLDIHPKNPIIKIINTI